MDKKISRGFVKYCECYELEGQTNGDSNNDNKANASCRELVVNEQQTRTSK